MESKTIKLGDEKDCVDFLFHVKLMRFDYVVKKDEIFEIIQQYIDLATLERRNGDINASNMLLKKAVILAQTFLLACQTSKRLKKCFNFEHLSKNL